MKTRSKAVIVGVLALSLLLSGCGSAGNSDSTGSVSIVSGVATADVQITTVALRDSSTPPQGATTAPDANGAFSIDVAHLNPPFALRAEDATGQTAFYALAFGPGVTDVDELSTVAAEVASASDHVSGTWEDNAMRRDAGMSLAAAIRSLQTVLKPLFDLYQVNVFGGDDREANRTALRALFHDASFSIQSGNLVVTNRLSSAVIYSAPLSNLTSGTFHPENMPPGPVGPSAIPCASFTYSPWSPAVCDSKGVQSRTVLTSSPTGCSGGSPILSETCTPPVSTCTSFTYSPWSPAVCDSKGVQSRTVLTSSPAGCSGGSPVLSETCTPPVSTCTSFTYSPWSPAVCDSKGVQNRTVLTSSPAGCSGGSPVLSETCTPPVSTCTSFTYSPWSPAVCDSKGVQNRTVLTSSPAGCSGGSPVLSETCTPPVSTCTSFTYSPWSPAVCDSKGVQSRTVLTSSPTGCSGGSPVLSETCTPPVSTCTSFTYSPWSPAVCDSKGVQNRTVLTSSPAGCSGGSPVLSETCTPPLDGAALYGQSCASCHGALASSSLKGIGISVTLIKSKGMTQGLSDAQLQAVVTAVGP